MELYADILAHKLCEEGLAAIIAQVLPEPEKTLETECYHALKKIREILNDNRLSDAECFQQIEAIVCLFENMGSGGGRHDFG